MLVYRDRHCRVRASQMLADALYQLERIAPGHAGAHDRAVRLLIDVGVLEAGVADAIHADADSLCPVTDRLRAASVAAGHLTWHSWRGSHDEMARWLDRLRVALGAPAGELPAEIETSVPEGYAYYGLYPETYLSAAAEVAQSRSKPRVVCIGLRSIGTSLSAVVAAALEELGREVRSLTLRPRGHPFDRRPRLSDSLAQLIQSHSDALFLLVDEGPGLSGSSLAGTARQLRELGVGDADIVLMPSWRTDGQELRSPKARETWRRSAQFTASFDEVWVSSGRLGDVVSGRRLEDLSAGAWRAVVYEGPARYPAVQPQHERRKFLARASGKDREPDLLLRFVGLGRYADGVVDRGQELAEAGFVMPPRRLEHGFMVTEFSQGEPVDRRDADESLIDTMARYLAHIRRTRPARSAVDSDLHAMARANIAEGLGEAAGDGLSRWLDTWPMPAAEPPTALDARMFPYEWLRTTDGFVKTDALDHHDDHFYPGPQDIAWDVAGTCVEFGFSPARRARFVERYRAASGDRSIEARLPFHEVAYLAFRLGYATLAAETLGATTDGGRFRQQVGRYRRMLANALAHGAPGLTSAPA
ncbi:MAG TPA: hypothetical protein VMY76_14610 [Gemmatimonadales bacterium]|nr:hypothetical protein [Gemmatimonadales bacterium]